MVSLVSIFALVAFVPLAEATDCSSEMVCTSGADVDSPKSSALLQVGVPQHKAAPQSVAAPKSAPQSVECNVKRAKETPLTEEGFAEVSASCCFEDVKAFTRRLIDSLGYKVCDEGGLSGISPFYACPSNPVTLADLKEELQDAFQAKFSKCHWLVDRYVECVPVSVECQVSVYFPEPAPQPVAKGFIAFRAENPSEMDRSSKIIDIVTEELALATGVEAKYINIVIATGTVDGDGSQSLLLIPKSQAFFVSAAGKDNGSTSSCKVFALYSFQDRAGAPEVLSESAVVDAMDHLDTKLLGSRITQDLKSLDPAVGVVDVAETSVCDKKSGKCNHHVVG